MKHSVLKYLEDVKLSIQDIETYTANVFSVLEVQQNQLLFDALCRRFAIIGEAIYQADKIDSNLAITDKAKIKGLRHIIVHDYDTVRPPDIWRIISKNLPTLKIEVIDLIEKYNKNESTS
jgi:uncharacterized protein with HEPN domain